MKKYLVLYHASQEAMEKMKSKSPEEMSEMKKAWFAWAEKVGDAVVDLGAPLGKSEFVGGESARSIGGYSFVQAEDVESAKALFDGHPHLAHGHLELLECMQMPTE
jgi:hypothetical protein